MSQHYPIHLNLSGRLCVVVGGGGVGERRAVGLLSAEAVVRVVTQEASEILQRLANENRLELRLKPYEPTDLESAFLVVAATDSREVNAQVTQDATARSVLVNVADAPAEGDFIVPAVVRRGDLEISVTTGGSLPALTQQITNELEQRFGAEYGQYVELMGEIRDYMKQNIPLRERSALARKVLAQESKVVALLQVGNYPEARETAFHLLLAPREEP